MTKQLTLIDAPADWRLDERTRRLGRAGIARARAALQVARRSSQDDDADRDRRPTNRAAKAA
jgi:hypothetical protein